MKYSDLSYMKSWVFGENACVWTPKAPCLGPKGPMACSSPPHIQSNPTHQLGIPWIWSKDNLYMRYVVSAMDQPRIMFDVRWDQPRIIFDVRCSDNLWFRQLFMALFGVRGLKSNNFYRTFLLFSSVFQRNPVLLMLELCFPKI